MQQIGFEERDLCLFKDPFLRSTVYREQYYTVQYPGISIENLPEENKYTEIPNRAISKYRFITEPQEILES